MRDLWRIAVVVCLFAVPSCVHAPPFAQRSESLPHTGQSLAGRTPDERAKLDEATSPRAAEQQRLLASLRGRPSNDRGTQPAEETESADKVVTAAHQNEIPPAPSLAMPVDERPNEVAPAPAPLPAHDGPLTLESVEQLAVANNPTLAQAQARIVAAEGKWVQVGLKPNPTVGYLGSEIGNDGKAGQHGGFVGQEFVTGDKLAINRQAACFEIVEAHREFDAQRYRVLGSVRIAFSRLLIAQRRVEIAEQLVKTSEQSVDAAEQLLEAMQVGRVDLLQARIEANSARVRLRNAKNRQLAAWIELTTLMGLPGMPPGIAVGAIEPDLAPVEYPIELTRLLEGSPELAAARANVGRARWALERARVEPIPNLDTQAGVQYDYASEYTIAQVQVGIAIPIHNANQGNIRRAHAEVVAAHQEVSRLELDLENRLAGAMERLANARYRIEQFQNSILPDARESLDLVTEAYREGEFDYLRVLTSQRTYFEASLEYLDALQDFWSARLAIDGFLLTEGLQTDIDAWVDDALPVP